ncbi:MAG: 6-carboxytetrahydropterin synthase [Bacteroidia bacterium]
MPVILTKKFGFESAHYLPMMPDGHKCRRMHGHSFRMEVNLIGDPDPLTGILIDYGDIKEIVQPYVKMLDHWCINDVGERENMELLKNPTSENLAKWFFEKLNDQLPGLYSIVIHETCTSRCEYRRA